MARINDQRILALETRLAAAEARIAELECTLNRLATNSAKGLRHE